MAVHVNIQAYTISELINRTFIKQNNKAKCKVSLKPKKAKKQYYTEFSLIIFVGFQWLKGRSNV
jgi:hypothetical protein